MTPSNYKTEKSYFRGNAKFGRSTRLIEKATGNVIFEAIGICSKADLLRSMNIKNNLKVVA